VKILNYRNEIIILEKDTQEHIQEFHPEITTEIIKKTLSSPDEVRQSFSNPRSELYYIFKCKKRYYCVVVKICSDGNFISTALTTSGIKQGRLIYKSGE